MPREEVGIRGQTRPESSFIQILPGVKEHNAPNRSRERERIIDAFGAINENASDDAFLRSNKNENSSPLSQGTVREPFSKKDNFFFKKEKNPENRAKEKVQKQPQE